ncbi:MAG: RagB/SusD family nutrient uptake outer membrane protein [Gemmatimonadales bacterium]|nr:MAG: RagB/SusD family nutrient uptake outer membrane protein [Gemmatimonadales bacterium]
MTKQRLVPALLTAIALGACNTDELLNVLPVDEISDEIAIVDAKSARAALAGAYSSLQSGDLYGGDWVLWVDVLTDDVEHTGTFGSWADGDLHNFRPQMGSIDGIWTNSYGGINRVNLLIQKVPVIETIDAADANDILGQAYGLRALHYFNLVRAWGDVPLVLVPPANLEEAAQVSRDPVSAVYGQIESDLAQAGSLLSSGSNDDHTFITAGFVTAFEAKVALYQQDWLTAVSKAQQVVASGEYSLVTNLRDAFSADGNPSAEDIFRVAFTTVDWNNQGYYYLYEGRFEQGATQEIYDLYEPGDLRFELNFPHPDDIRSDGIEVTKYPTPIGSEDIHVLRYADVLLILAEALAEQNELSDAVGYLNQIRARAGVSEYVFGTDLVSQQDVLDAVYLERRLEFAFEGERWHDLVRTGRAVAVLGPSGRFEPHEVIWPIPVGEMDTAPNLVQNPGY